ncbi:MAG: LexA-binding, inner rane-associated putative hydrolase [Chloroflexi bacterium]|nr:LexA-binding, inner rane-associated putative hydrolase [Chloroflexota bacterium]
MLGRTHLIFGTTTTLAAVTFFASGLFPTAGSHNLIYDLQGTPHTLTVPSLEPIVWLALAFAAAVGSLLPDIDQPGSLVTRIPANRARDFRRAGIRYGGGPVLGSPARLTVDAVSAGGMVASAMLGGNSGRQRGPYRLLLIVLAILAASLAAMFRWLPPRQALTLSAHTRHSVAFLLACIAVVAGLIAAGGIAHLINRLPGHHRGFTHAPAVGLALTAAGLILGPSLFPALPGVGAAFGIGYLTHLAADAMTIKGIPLWLPGQHRPSLHLLPPHVRVQTGSAGETVFNFVWPPVLILLVVLTGR